MEELLHRIALATERTAQLLEQKRPGDTVDMAPSPAEPPAVEPGTWWASGSGAPPFRVDALSRDGKVVTCKTGNYTWSVQSSDLADYTYLGTDATRRSGKPGPETESHMPGFSKEVSDALKATHAGEEALGDSRVRSGSYPRRWGTLNGLCVRYCTAFQSGDGIARAELELVEHVRWIIATGVVKP